MTPDAKKPYTFAPTVRIFLGERTVTPEHGSEQASANIHEALPNGAAQTISDGKVQ